MHHGTTSFFFFFYCIKASIERQMLWSSCILPSCSASVFCLCFMCCTWDVSVKTTFFFLKQIFFYSYKCTASENSQYFSWGEVLPGKILCLWLCCCLVKVHSWHHNSGADAKSLKWHTPSKSLIACSVPWFSNLLAWQRWRWPWSPPRILHILAFALSI